MCAFVVPGAREKMGDEDGNREPGEDHQFGRARAAANEMNGNRGKRDQAAQKTRRDKRAMTRCRQRLLLGGRMHQRRNVVPYRRKQAHNPNRTPEISGRAPHFSGAGSCQRPLKPTLRWNVTRRTGASAIACVAARNGVISRSW